ncbi:YbgA family protein [Staphylococcus warneri]|uniref:YbgA family protein n=1 Tax=Staphylococcus warneri TaxID=1292 RepID=UPI0009523609|nr:YbgA family protein [Staphylococcus warneri]MBE9429113.1 YbgA family protein [Staphylococcus epidermidis]MCD8804463.1 YbgA family protein [Staphylococcus warneri]MCD8806730.1 YbgA family protein [Staphylococcus warneri]MDU9352512.1 YbgA family protein [Staphylococcus warneri]OLS07760.1 type II DNA modification enzyme [Staphylococcus epidermidis]
MKERGHIEQLWREEKYRVLLHSQKQYDAIREKLKSQVSYEEIRMMIEHAITIEPSQGSVINAYDHMWGYFKKWATDEEKQSAQKLKELFINHDVSIHDLMSFLNVLAIKYEVHYIQQSTVLKE